MWEKKDSPKPQPVEPPSRVASSAVSSGANIGKSIVIKGELSGDEDLTIDGNIEGKVSLRDHDLTIGQHGRLNAELDAKRIIIRGTVTGNVTASEKVEVLEGGRLDGDIASPRLSISDGAHFRGKVDMEANDHGHGSAHGEDSVAEVAPIASKVRR